MTKVTIDRELLERELLSVLDFSDSNLRRVVDHLIDAGYTRAAPRQPEGEGLEVVAWNITVKMDGRTWSEYTEKLPFLPDAKVTWHSEPEPVCRLSDAQRAIAELREECERLRMQLAACGVVALANTPESAAQARQMHPDYMSASCSDVADAVDREITLRKQRNKLAGLLREVMPDYAAPQGKGHLYADIDAALAEIK